MGAVGQLFKLVNLEQETHRPGDLLVEVGTDSFDVSATTKEVTTQLTEVMVAVLTIDDATPVANDLLSTDRVVTTSAVTVARPAGTTSNLSFNFVFIGRKTAAA